MKTKILTSLIIISMFFSSCATILGGKKNTISTKSVYPPQTKTFINNKEIGEGIFKTRISKYEIQEGDTLFFKCEGYHTDTLVISRKVHEWYTALDFISTLGLGLLIDVASGNIYRPNAKKLEINLTKKGDEK